MQVVKAPDNKLRIQTKTVKKISPQLLKTLEEMIRLTRTFTDPEGVGLAATQIGQNEQYFIAKNTDESFEIVINPKIVSFGSKTKKFFEGCLSIPNYWGEIKRPTTVKVSYMNKEGKHVITNLRGTKAWIFQHEYDHLHGKLFIDLVLQQKGRLFKVVGKDRAGAEIFEEMKI